MLENPLIQHSIYAFIIILGSAVVGRILKFLLNSLFKKLFAYTDTTLDDRILDVIRGRIVTLSIIGGIYLAIKEMEKIAPANINVQNPVIHYLNMALFVFLVFVLTRLAIKLVQTTFNWYLDEVSLKTHSTITPTIAPLTTKLLNILLFMIAGMIVLDFFGINIGSFLVSLGVGSLAVALAAQETVANMIAGFVILIDQPFRIGDRIKLPTGEEGNVSQIGLRSTRILTLDNNLMVIPNSDLVKNRIINLSFPNNAIRSTIDINVGYQTDIPKAKELLTSIIREHAGLSKDFPLIVQVNNFGESAVTLRIVIESVEYTERFTNESEIREKVLSEFVKNGITIPYPQRTIQIVNSNELKTS